MAGTTWDNLSNCLAFVYGCTQVALLLKYSSSADTSFHIWDIMGRSQTAVPSSTTYGFRNVQLKVRVWETHHSIGLEIMPWMVTSPSPQLHFCHRCSHRAANMTSLPVLLALSVSSSSTYSDGWLQSGGKHGRKKDLCKVSWIFSSFITDYASLQYLVLLLQLASSFGKGAIYPLVSPAATTSGWLRSSQGDVVLGKSS